MPLSIRFVSLKPSTLCSSSDKNTGIAVRDGHRARGAFSHSGHPMMSTFHVDECDFINGNNLDFNSRGHVKIPEIVSVPSAYESANCDARNFSTTYGTPTDNESSGASNITCTTADTSKGTDCRGEDIVSTADLEKEEEVKMTSHHSSERRMINRFDESTDDDSSSCDSEMIELAAKAMGQAKVRFLDDQHPCINRRSNNSLTEKALEMHSMGLMRRESVGALLSDSLTSRLSVSGNCKHGNATMLRSVLEAIQHNSSFDNDGPRGSTSDSLSTAGKDNISCAKLIFSDAEPKKHIFYGGGQLYHIVQTQMPGRGDSDDSDDAIRHRIKSKTSKHDFPQPLLLLIVVLLMMAWIALVTLVAGVDPAALPMAVFNFTLLQAGKALHIFFPPSHGGLNRPAFIGRKCGSAISNDILNDLAVRRANYIIAVSRAMSMARTGDTTDTKRTVAAFENTANVLFNLASLVDDGAVPQLDISSADMSLVVES